jgi:hypothetical protein
MIGALLFALGFVLCLCVVGYLVLATLFEFWDRF